MYFCLGEDSIYMLVRLLLLNKKQNTVGQEAVELFMTVLLMTD